jgi:hypothetical protein
MTCLCLTLATAVVLAASAEAPACHDEAAARSRACKPPRVEIGGVVSGILPIVSEDGTPVVVGGGPRVAVHLWRQIGIELLAEAVGPVESSGTFGYYLTQVKIPIRKSAGGARTLSLTAGVAGGASYERIHERRIVRLDGSTVVHPGFQRFRVDTPRTLSVGVSGDRVFSRHASSVWAMQALIGPLAGVAVRASVGVSFGVGGFR